MTLLHKVGATARDILHSNTDNRYALSSAVQKCVQDAVKAAQDIGFYEQDEQQEQQPHQGEQQPHHG